MYTLPISTHMSGAMHLRGVTKYFGSTIALDAASLSVRQGTVHALLGENGAGKTTLMRIAFGMLTPDTGSIIVNDLEQHFASPADAIAQGVGMVHQHFMLIPAMTVAENIALGKRGRYNAVQEREHVHTISMRYGLPIDPDAIVRTLPIGAQQRVEILKALSREAQILILDEPTAVLAPAEARELLQKMRAFADGGGTVILITHKLRDALEFSDDVTVLRRGKTVLSEPRGGLDERALAEAMIGTIPTVDNERGDRIPGSASWNNGTMTPATSIPPRTLATQPIFQLDDISIRDQQGVDRLKHISLAVYGGEILGIAAVEGNGQYELLRVLAGRREVTTGRCIIPDTVGFVPEDRHRDAIILDFPLYENVALFHAGRRHGGARWSAYRTKTADMLRVHDIRAASVETTARTLSGGNQQKFVVGREMDGAPQALVVENPTRGLDVQATAAVHRRLQDARAQGAAIVVYSSDLDEVLALADRIVVVYEGTVREVQNDRDIVGRAMLGGARVQ